jgi:hypothetical protein
VKTDQQLVLLNVRPGPACQGDVDPAGLADWLVCAKVQFGGGKKSPSLVLQGSGEEMSLWLGLNGLELVPVQESLFTCDPGVTHRKAIYDKLNSGEIILNPSGTLR